MNLFGKTPVNRVCRASCFLIKTKFNLIASLKILLNCPLPVLALNMR
jgi:hypothetical protein